MFSQLVETAEAAKPVVEAIAGLGLASVLAAVLLALLNRNSQLRRWRQFRSDLDKWAINLIRQQDRHPKELGDDEWRAQCARMLYDVQFTPTEITQIMDVAIIVAKVATLNRLDTREW